jgi:hypothetical protein
MRARPSATARLRYRGSQNLVTAPGDENIVLDTNTDVPPLARDLLVSGRHVQSRLDGHDHAGLEHPPLAPDLVVADVVHIHAQPVTGAVHVELAVAPLLDDGAGAPLDESERHQPLREHFDRRFMGRVPVITRLHLLDSGFLGLQHHLVER